MRTLEQRTFFIWKIRSCLIENPSCKVIRAWSQSRKVVFFFLLQNVWFDCREWSNTFQSISKIMEIKYLYRRDALAHFAQIPWNESLSHCRFWIYWVGVIKIKINNKTTIVIWILYLHPASKFKTFNITVFP